MRAGAFTLVRIVLLLRVPQAVHSLPCNMQRLVSTSFRHLEGSILVYHGKHDIGKTWIEL